MPIILSLPAFVLFARAASSERRTSSPIDDPHAVTRIVFSAEAISKLCVMTDVIK